jgi:glutathione S-transferase
MEPVAIVLTLALLEYFVFGVLVGRARGQYGVEAPATTGHPIFERYHRVHQNTLEQLAIFVPALWLFGVYVSPGVAALLGLVFIAGRIVYLRGYVEDPKKRSTGTLITLLAQAALLLGGGVGALLAWL